MTTYCVLQETDAITLVLGSGLTIEEAQKLRGVPSETGRWIEEDDEVDPFERDDDGCEMEYDNEEI